MASRLLRRFGELALGVLVALVVSVGVQKFVEVIPIPRPSYVPNALIMLCDGLAVLVIVAVVAARRLSHRWSIATAWVVLPAALTLLLSAVLQGSRYFLGGVEIDQMFRVEYFTRMTSTASLVDFSYQGVAPYYPAGWFWLGGRFANLAGLPGWAAYKPFAILTVAVVAVVTFWLWSFSTRRRVALLLTALECTLGLGIGSEATTVAISEPYSWLAVATIPPLLVLGTRLVTALRSVQRPPGTYSAAVVIGVALGAYGATYTLYAAFAGFALALVAVAAAVLAWRRPGLGVGPAVLARRLAAHVGVLAVPAAVLMGLVWWPFFLAVLGGAGGHNIAAHYLPPGSTSFPLPFLEFSVTGALCLVGLVWLVLGVLGRSRYPLVARGLAVGVVACYAWFALSNLALVLNTSLLSFRMVPVINYLLLAAAGMAVIEALQQRPSWLPEHRRKLVRTLAVLLAVGVLLGSLQKFPSDNKRLIDYAFNDYYPTGHTALGVSHPSDRNYWVPQLRKTIASLTHRPPQQNIVFAQHPEMLLDTTPYWRFQAATPHYADPLGNFAARRAEILKWSHAPDAATLAAELDHSRFAPPNVFIFDRSGKKLKTLVRKDIFPAEPNVYHIPVTFRSEQFAGPQFVRRNVGPFAVIVRK